MALVFNPNAGKGKARELLERVIGPRFRERDVELVEIPTERVNHGREIAANHDLEGFDGIVAMGGDGTYHEIANGLIGRSGAVPPLGIIPMGSGNAIVADFRQNQKRLGKEVSVYTELDAVMEWAADRVLGGHSCCVDTMEVTTCDQSVHAASMVYIGMIAETDILAEPLRCMGPARFDVVALWQALKKQNMARCHIQLTRPDGSEEPLTNIPENGGSAWLSVILNLGQHWSDKLRASPTSRLDDRVGELNILKADVTRRQLLQALQLLETGAQCHVPGVMETISFTELAMTFPSTDPEVGLQPGVINIDGEIFRHDGRLTVNVTPQHIRIFCDPEQECASAALSDAGAPGQARQRSLAEPLLP